MNSEGPVVDAPICPYFSISSPYSSHSTPSSPLKSSSSIFYDGTIGSSSTQAIYVHVRPHDGTSSEDSGFWVTVPWSQLARELLCQETVIQSVMEQLRLPGHAKQRMQALRTLSNPVPQGLNGSSLMQVGPFNGGYPPMPSPPPAPEFKMDSPLFSLPEDLSLWNSHRSSLGSSPFSPMPVSSSLMQKMLYFEQDLLTHRHTDI